MNHRRLAPPPAFRLPPVCRRPVGIQGRAQYPYRPPAVRLGRACQQGQGAVEFLLAATPVLLLGLGAIEAVHWYFTRQAVSLALVQAARAAITQHANPVALDQAFSEALLPLHAGPTASASRARLQKARARREGATGLPAWRIRILSPSTASFNDFASPSPDLPRPGLPIIDNDYLHEQHRGRLAQGWQEGRGPLSGQTTLEANTLTLHLTWLHEPLLPGMKQLLKQVAPSDSRYGSQAMASAGYLPIHRQVALVMQSHPVQWEMPAHGRVVRLAGHGAAAEAWKGGTRPPGAPAEYLPPPAGLPDHDPSSPPSGHPGAYADQAGPTRAALPGADSGQASPCTGLWCLDFFKSASPQGAEDSAGYGGGSPASGEPQATESGPGAGAGPEDGYRDAESGAGPPAPEDCPGCCDG